MLNRWSVNALLKSIILAMSVIVVATLATGAWDAYQRFGMANGVTALTQASGAVFRALNHLRLDRSFTERALRAEQVGAPDRKQVMDARDGGTPALKATIELLGNTDLVGRQGFIDALRRQVAVLEPLQAESAAAFDKPKAARRETLSKDYVAIETQIIDNLDNIGTELAAAVKLKDAFVDGMMTVKQLGWIARSAAGGASVMM